MKDYRELSDWEKAKVDKAIIDEIEPKHHINEHNGFEWDERFVLAKKRAYTTKVDTKHNC